MATGETYTPGYTDTATALMARRRLASHGALREWAAHPDAVFARAWFEATGIR
jgi:hypothetical protein